jgi:hypothetical protein
MPKPVGLHFFSFFSTQKSSLRPMPLGHYSPKNGGHLQMSLQALYQVTTIQLVHDNTHEAPRNEAGFSRCNSLDFPWENVRRKKPMEWKPYSWFFNPILICGKAYITVENYCGKLLWKSPGFQSRRKFPTENQSSGILPRSRRLNFRAPFVVHTMRLDDIGMILGTVPSWQTLANIIWPTSRSYGYVMTIHDICTLW